MQKMRFSNHHVLGITSPRAECGKTVTAINLAFSMARQPNQVVLLADLDLRKPSIAKCLGIKSQSDVHDVLSGDARLHNSCVGLNIGGSGLRVLPCSGTVVDPSLLFNSGNMEELLSGLRDKAGQGIVIVDLPPVLVADDVIAVLPHIDNVLLVAASGQTTPAEIEECERLLSGADSLDIILNKAKVSAKSYY